MNTKALKFRSISAAQVAATRQIGRGLRRVMSHANETWHWYLRLSDHAEEAFEWIVIHTALGSLMLEKAKAEQFLNAFSTTAFVLLDDCDEADQWFTELFNAGLTDEAKALFGFVEQSEAFLKEGLPCRFDLSWSESQDTCRAIIPYPTLSKLIEQGQWTRMAPRQLPDLVISKPLSLGRVSVSKTAMTQLQPGDVVVPSDAIFSIEGDGSIVLGNRRLQLQYQQQGTALAFLVTQLTVETDEETQMDGTVDDMPMTEQRLDDTDSLTMQDNVLDDDVAISDDFDAMVSLSIRCGNVSMKLSELSQLTEGAVIMATGERPGQATLHHGKRMIARGELVDVDGRLGLQLLGMEASI